jgi:hypothetical protein
LLKDAKLPQKRLKSTKTINKEQFQWLTKATRRMECALRQATAQSEKGKEKSNVTLRRIHAKPRASSRQA